MGHIEICADRVAHGVDVAQPCPCKGDACKVGAEHHGAGGFLVLTVGHKAAQAAADKLHGLFRHGIGEWGGVAGDVGLHGVDEGVHTAGRSDGCGSRHDQLGVQHGVSGQDLVAEHRELIVALGIRDHGRGCHLAAGACRGGDSDHRHDRAGHLMVALVVGDPAAIVGQDAHSLAHVHRAAAAQRYDAGGPAFPVQVHGLVDHRHSGVGYHIQIAGALQPRRLNDILHLFDDTDLFQSAVRHQQDLVRAALGQDLRQLFQTAHAKLDVLGDLKVEVFHHCASFLSLPVKNGVRSSGSDPSATACPVLQSKRCSLPRGPACPCSLPAFSGQPAWWRHS